MQGRDAQSHVGEVRRELSVAAGRTTAIESGISVDQVARSRDADWRVDGGARRPHRDRRKQLVAAEARTLPRHASRTPTMRAIEFPLAAGRARFRYSGQSRNLPSRASDQARAPAHPCRCDWSATC